VSIEDLKPLFWYAAPVAVGGSSLAAGAFWVRHRSAPAAALTISLALVIAFLAAAAMLPGFVVDRHPVTGERIVVDRTGALRLYLYAAAALSGLAVPVALWRLLRSVEPKRPDGAA